MAVTDKAYAAPLDTPEGSGALVRYPPGPWLPRVVQTLGFAKYPHRVMPLWRRRYGDTFALRLVPDYRIVFLSDPADIKAVFTGPDSVFHAGEANGGLMRPILGNQSVVVLDEQDHRRLRTLLVPAFTGAALRGYQDMIASTARVEFDGWPLNRTIGTYERMRKLTAEVILRVVFGVTEPTRLAAVRPMVHRMLDFNPLTFFGFQYPGLQRFPPWRSYAINRQRLYAWLDTEIANRRQAPDLADRTDVLSRLLQIIDEQGDRLSDAVIHDQLVTAMLAGYETTAATLAWAVHELAHQPSHRHAAQRAADRGDVDYLTAVVKETLRRRPIVFMVIRKVTQPVQIGGYDIPAGTMVAPCISLVHADATLHDDPDDFRPERFLTTNPPANTWIPFGGGARRCLGAAFGTQEAVVVLRELLNRFDISPAGRKPEKPRVRSLLIVPSRGARITVTTRNSNRSTGPSGRLPGEETA